VIEIAPGHYRRQDFKYFPEMNYGIYWGDEFEASKISNSSYQLTRLIKPDRIVHLHFQLGSTPYPKLLTADFDDLKNMLDATYKPKDLIDYLDKIGGAVELNDCSQSVWVIIHLPAEYEDAFIKDMPNKWPQLAKGEIGYLITEFNSKP
jgi:hypothetical protein